MIFDKAQYRKKRKAGKRGQGEYPVLSVRNEKLSKPPSARPRGVQRNKPKEKS